MKTLIGLNFTLIFLCFYFTVPAQAIMHDRDGNTYKTFVIHNKVWMAGNLNVAHYRNGDAIPEAKTGPDWDRYGENKTGCWCYYEFDGSNGKKYGKLYNWFAVTDPRGLAPTGWHVPKDEEWLVFTDYKGNYVDNGRRMKTQEDWGMDKFCWGTNETGFSGLPGGTRSAGAFLGLGTVGNWWCSTEAELNFARIRSLSSDLDELRMNSAMKQGGNSVRCVKD